MANALVRVNKEFQPLVPPRGSVAAHVQAAVPRCRVVAAFHHLPATELGHIHEPIDSDVLICGDDPSAVKTVSEIVAGIPGCRPLDAGELSNATAIEAFTAVLLQLNVRYKTRVAPKLTGIKQRPACCWGSLNEEPGMTMQLYDTPRRAIVPFEPNEHVLMYTCGITPYDATHLGHAATFIAYDVLQRRLLDRGHTVRCVRNVTDVDDPLFAKARQLGVHYLDLAAGEEARFERDMEALNALPVASSPRASSAIPDIRGFIGMVLDRGFAYEAGGSVYFDVTKFESFGSLSHYTYDEMIIFAKERGGNIDDPNKRSPLDFVLWHPVGIRRAVVGHDVGPGTAGLAHRVFGAGAARTRHDDRPARRGSGPDLPPPRVRAGAVGGGDRRAVRHALDAHGADRQGRREDVEEPRQPRVRRPAPRDVRPAVDPTRHHRAPLPRSVGVGRRADAAQRPPTRQLVDAPAVEPRTARRGSASASTTTSTRRAPSG